MRLSIQRSQKSRQKKSNLTEGRKAPYVDGKFTYGNRPRDPNQGTMVSTLNSPKAPVGDIKVMGGAAQPTFFPDFSKRKRKLKNGKKRGYR